MYESEEFKKILEELLKKLDDAHKAKDSAKIKEINEELMKHYADPQGFRKKKHTIIESPQAIDPEVKDKLDKTNQKIRQEEGKKIYKETEKQGRFHNEYEARRQKIAEARGTSRKGKLDPKGIRASRRMRATQAGPYNKPIFMGQEKNIHLPGSEVSNYILRQRAKNRLLRRLAAGATAAGEFAERYSIPLTIAAEALSSDDVNVGEDYELEEMKKEIDREKFLNERFEGDKEKIKDFKRKEEELLRTPVRPSDLLDVTEESEPENRTMVPDLASSEEDDDMSMSNYDKKMKKKLGYS